MDIMIPIAMIQGREKEPCPFCKFWVCSSVHIGECSNCRTTLGYSNYEPISRHHYIAMMKDRGVTNAIANKQYTDYKGKGTA